MRDPTSPLQGEVKQLLLQKHVIRRVWRRVSRASLVAGAFVLAALRVDALDRGDAPERAGAVRLDHLELEPRDVLRGGAVGAADRLAGDAAAVGMLPGRSRIVAA